MKTDNKSAELDLIEVCKLSAVAANHLTLAFGALESIARKLLVAAESSTGPVEDQQAYARQEKDESKTKTQVFKTLSFWRTSDGNDIFTVPAGVEAPARGDPNFVKISQGQFMVLKNAGADEISWPFESDRDNDRDNDSDDGSDLI